MPSVSLVAMAAMLLLAMLAAGASGRFLGLDYGPYRTGQAPWGVQPTAAQLTQDMEMIASKQIAMVRVYHTTCSGGCNTTAATVAAAQAAGLRIVLQAWLGPDDTAAGAQANWDEVVATAKLATQYGSAVVPLVVCGSEVLLRGDMTVQHLGNWCQLLREMVPLSIPLAYADGLSAMQEIAAAAPANNTALLEAIEVFGIDSYAWWEKVNFTDAVATTIGEYQQMTQLAPLRGKRFLIWETNWPNNSTGMAGGYPVATAAQQATFVQQMLAQTQQLDINLFLFEAFDEPWKSENGGAAVESHWGLASASRQPYPAWDMLPNAY